MSVIFSSEELTATDRAPVSAPDLGLVSLGTEFAGDDCDLDAETAELECLPMLASDLPLNSEVQAVSSASHR